MSAERDNLRKALALSEGKLADALDTIRIRERRLVEVEGWREALGSALGDLLAELKAKGEAAAAPSDGVVRLTQHDRQMLTDAADYIADYGKGWLDFQGTRVALRAIVERANAVEPVPPEGSQESQLVTQGRRWGDTERLRAAQSLPYRQIITEIHRLRRNAGSPGMKHGITTGEVRDALLDEVVEVGAEEPGSPAAIREAAGCVAVALHLIIAHGGDPATALDEEQARLRKRLDHVESGGTWAEAKAAEGNS